MASSGQPNVLFIAMDDLNDWIGVMGGHPQTITPNLDRLANSSVLFTNAHCTAPACNPSRTAIFTGRSPHKSGVYSNNQKMREFLPETELIPKTFAKNGYRSSGSGKLLHYFIDARSWDEYYPPAETDNPFPRTLYPDRRPLSLPRGGPWQYVETDWGPLHATDEEYGGDYLVAEWISEQLEQPQDKPFFLACGIYRPHEPWFVPKKYFEPFPLDQIEFPPGYLDDDLEDLPEAGKKLGPNRYFDHIREQGQWRQAVQGYLASIHFGDAMVGKVLNALDNSPHAENTIVVLWSDHGWHLGEKQHWQKYTGWRACTRIPLMIRVPEKTPNLPEGTKPSVCDQPVNLLSLAPTLLELCGIPANPEHDGPSLLPLLKNPEAEWNHASVTYLGTPGTYSVSGKQWRLIHYTNGDEELYDIKVDPYEWKNLAGQSEYLAIRDELFSTAPKNFAAKPDPSVASLPELPWNEIEDKSAPASIPDGAPFDVVFINKNSEPVRLFWMNRQGITQGYGIISPGKEKRQQTRPGAVWMIQSADGESLGYFIVDDRSAKAVIPD
ncbi:sulfatase-like hydrolase/transferase [uncultured Rubinisphaera sp.]|uniref:sulfatase-like hydrolase/transferase n=1 Tax=uncultured Rubinisphaera sp. TaxID=1678686 RepID=UPI0030DB3353